MAKLDTAKRNALSSKDFALPAQRKFPVENKSHAANAKARASQAVNAGKMSKGTEAKIDAKANKVLAGKKNGGPVLSEGFTPMGSAKSTPAKRGY